MERIYDDSRGRPKDAETRRRTARFLMLVADGVAPVDAAREAKIGPWRALRIVTEYEFHSIVDAIRAGRLGPTAVTLATAADQQDAA